MVQSWQRRITSYNVCYTKLLRVFNTLTGFKYIGEKMNQFDETGEHTYLFGYEESYGYLAGNRITSYNVCYTKLLRTRPLRKDSNRPIYSVYQMKSSVLHRRKTGEPRSRQQV